MTCRNVPDFVTDTECSHCGNYIEMKNAAGTIKYCHLTDGTLLLKKGDKVTKGKKVAQMGQSDNATGIRPHVALTDNEGKIADFRKNCQLDGWKPCPRSAEHKKHSAVNSLKNYILIIAFVICQDFV